MATISEEEIAAEEWVVECALTLPPMNNPIMFSTQRKIMQATTTTCSKTIIETKQLRSGRVGRITFNRTTEHIRRDRIEDV